MRTPSEALLADIDAFLSRSGMAPSAFGAASMGDPNLVTDLRAGREPRFSTTQRVLAFIEAQIAEHETVTS